MRWLLAILAFVVAPAALVYFLWKRKQSQLVSVRTRSAGLVPRSPVSLSTATSDSPAETQPRTGVGAVLPVRIAQSTANGTLPIGSVLIDNKGSAAVAQTGAGLANAGAEAGAIVKAIPGISALAPLASTVFSTVGKLGDALFGANTAPDQTQVTIAQLAAHNAQAHGIGLDVKTGNAVANHTTSLLAGVNA